MTTIQSFGLWMNFEIMHSINKHNGDLLNEAILGVPEKRFPGLLAWIGGGLVRHVPPLICKKSLKLTWNKKNWTTSLKLTVNFNLKRPVPVQHLPGTRPVPARRFHIVVCTISTHNDGRLPVACQTFLSSFLCTAEHMHDVRCYVTSYSECMHYSDLTLL
jgi:hypothetical protein